MTGRERVCPSCGQPVGTVVRRHKTLGAFVPVWRPGPCRNPLCPRHREQAREEGLRDAPEQGRATTSGAAPPDASGAAADAENGPEDPGRRV
ncbi:hypothetical protein [Streptomyces sp. NPDC007264]|uniref:hypothetical protein n=1 Tax=Streptomyces sp. NPDC007264 TaxID=3364777 RepID=UPI0036DA4664